MAPKKHGSAPTHCINFCHCPPATTDVQDVSICQKDDDTFSITCTYLSGSEGRGCIYTLVSRELDVENVTGTIYREDVTQTIGRNNIRDICRFGQVIARDWEENGIPGAIAISGSKFTC